MLRPTAHRPGSKAFHQPPSVDLAVALVEKVIQQPAGHRESATLFAGRVWHGARQDLLDARATIDEQGVRCVIHEPEPVLDRWVGACGPSVREHVGADLRKGDLEVHEVWVVLAAGRRLAQALDRFLKRAATPFSLWWVGGVSAFS